MRENIVGESNFPEWSAHLRFHRASVLCCAIFISFLVGQEDSICAKCNLKRKGGSAGSVKMGWYSSIARNHCGNKLY